MEKRFYWLKLREDVFSDIYLKGLRREEKGDLYTLIYLKLALQTLNSGGYVRFKRTAGTFAEELAYTINEAPADVAEALACLLRLHLAERKGKSTFFFPIVCENVGTECDSARRMREYRERKALLRDKAAVTPSQGGYTDTEKDTETDKETETKGNALSPAGKSSFIAPRTRRRENPGQSCNLFKQMLREEEA